MGELTRNYDWRGSPLGPSDQWSFSLRTLVQMMLSSRFPMLIFWGPELITFYNDAFRPSLGNNGKHPSSLGQRGEESWAESWPVIGPMIHNIMAGGEAVWFEDQKLPIYREGQMGYAYWTYSFSPLTNDDGGVNGVLVTCSETTKAVESVAQLQSTNTELHYLLEQNQLLGQQAQASQKRLLNLFEQSPVAIALISKDDLVFQTANPFYGYLVGRSPEELVGKSLLEALPELQGQGFDQLLEEVITTGQPFIANEVQVKLVRQTQLETIYVDLTYQPHREANGLISGILVVATDVTAQVRSRQQVEAQAGQLQRLLENTPDVITRWGTDRRLLYCNSAFVEKTDQALEHLLGKTNREMGQPDSIAGPYMDCLQCVLETGLPQEYSNSFPTSQGETFFHSRLVPEFCADGKVESVLAIARDVTRQILDRRALEESEAALKNAIELAELGTWRTEIKTGETQLSQRHVDMFGLATRSVPYEQALVQVHPADRQRVRMAFLAAQQPGSDGHYEAEYRIINGRTGEQRHVRARGAARFDVQGQPISISGTAQDVTLEREAQLMLEAQVQARTQELHLSLQDLNRSNENLQQFAYVASHDLQEPLRKIQSFGDILKTQYAAGLGDGVDLLERMQAAAGRMSTLIQDLLAFSRITTQQESEAAVALDQVMEGILSDLELVINETGAQITVAPLPTVSGNQGQLGLLFQNLVNNALKFGQPGIAPLIQIRNQRLVADQLPPGVHPTRLASHYYRIDVVDNGIGFEQKYADRIFQVFQRLHGKNNYAGTGIGLAVCEKVAANHGGAITASSQLGQGATFSVYLPT